MRTPQQIYLNEIERAKQTFGEKAIPILQSDLIRKFTINCLLRFETDFELCMHERSMLMIQCSKLQKENDELKNK